MNISATHPEITTTRLHLRPLQATDAEAILAIRSNESVNTYLDRKPSTTIDEAAAFISSINQLTANGDGQYWAITIKDSGALVGTICLYNFDKGKGIAEIGYELLPEYQGKGFMQEAISSTVSYSFDMMGAKVITAFPRTDNHNSIKLLQKAGFKIDPAYSYLNGHDDDGKYQTYVLNNTN
ncbi:GNAT family N-acetyltransferase [Mucilaginibacter ginkgonis]|uniref:GNAT family N-acetyltransferase n=1 Tax=Mucilaginibacter ginkgonis TaxID=2682091 RepID=A0A6I4I310_9SPHI|nr:GNAT family N-acetyltransferase [Mucilaginibacter ginkgonis]QQL49116.1 GNAT family N-acetyltransferase [Mucilaginibacter ginkgonis]